MWILTPFSWKSHQVAKVIERPWKTPHRAVFFFWHNLYPSNRLLFNSLNNILNFSKDHNHKAIKRSFNLPKAFLGSPTTALTIEEGKPSIYSGWITNYLQLYQILPWAKPSSNLDHFLHRNIHTVLGPPQSWWFSWQISDPWEISFGYFSNTMSELARNGCPYKNHGGRLKGLNMVEWEPKYIQFYQVWHNLDMSLTPVNQFLF